LKATSRRGVDVVLNSLVGDLLHESWEILAPFGVFVEVGKRDIQDSGMLDMRVFERAATFTAFDLADLYWSTSVDKQRTWSRYDDVYQYISVEFLTDACVQTSST
jgi:NADPH:quinone reductase-like Zn-dependent oxidoreductase